MDKFKFFVPTIVAVLLVLLILPSIQPQTSKASTCTARASAGGVTHLFSAKIGLPGPLVVPGGCASSSGAQGGPSGGTASQRIAGNPSACSSFSSVGGFSSDSGSSVSCSTAPSQK